MTEFRERIIVDGGWCDGKPSFILIYVFGTGGDRCIVWDGPDHASALKAAALWEASGALLVDRWEARQ